MTIIKSIEKSKLFYITTPIFYVNAGRWLSGYFIFFQYIFIFSMFWHSFQHLTLAIYIRPALLIVFIAMNSFGIVHRSCSSVPVPTNMALKFSKPPVRIIKIQNNIVIKYQPATNHCSKKLASAILTSIERRKKHTISRLFIIFG